MISPLQLTNCRIYAQANKYSLDDNEMLLCYLKQTIFHGIHPTMTVAHSLTTCSDADSSENMNDCTSTVAYIILGN